MTENMKKFMEIISAEGAESIQRMNRANKDELIAMAAEKGITLTEGDFEKSNGELTEDELATVAGGDSCFCAMVGSGLGFTETPHDDDCICYVGGTGDGKKIDAERKSTRCACVVGGGGKSYD